MNQLFQVRTRQYVNYYTLASSYDEAISKVENYIAEEMSNNTNSVVSADGSLNLNIEKNSRYVVELLGEIIM